jgi:hypothetical protein
MKKLIFLSALSLVGCVEPVPYCSTDIKVYDIEKNPIDTAQRIIYAEDGVFENKMKFLAYPDEGFKIGSLVKLSTTITPPIINKLPIGDSITSGSHTDIIGVRYMNGRICKVTYRYDNTEYAIYHIQTGGHLRPYLHGEQDNCPTFDLADYSNNVYSAWIIKRILKAFPKDKVVK